MGDVKVLRALTMNRAFPDREAQVDAHVEVTALVFEAPLLLNDHGATGGLGIKFLEFCRLSSDLGF